MLDYCVVYMDGGGGSGQCWPTAFKCQPQPVQSHLVLDLIGTWLGFFGTKGLRA